MDAGFADVRGDVKLVLAVIETPGGQMAGMKHSLPSAEDAPAV
jgi:hypothetical protein